jgi:hypothetical protein
MSLLHVILIVTGAIGIAVCGIASNAVSEEMVDEVNRALPEREQFSPGSWYYSKTARLMSEHARLHPNSRLRKKRRSLMFVGLACLAVCGLAILSW